MVASVKPNHPSLPSEAAELAERFTKKINVFIADDDETVVRMLLAKLFTSPLFNCSFASTLPEIHDFLRSSKRSWHCWILDMGFQNNELGTQILDNFPYFDYAVVLSGQKSMGLAAEALKKGAIDIYDKNPQVFYQTNPFFSTVCGTAALGYILDGKKTGSLNIFKALKDNFIKPPTNGRK
ncbi:MAG: hypothetical protein PHC61_00860 [Chitinivibrionales bacterium]|nr:hypothetical protein [Chitinivibrionales bacterium]